jgi:hypothetical protein
MGVKNEITWKRQTPEGDRCQINARRIGREWRFFQRRQRFEVWKPLPQPPLEDWLTLLDAVRRRIARHLARPEDEERLQHVIREHFPDASF